MDTATRDRNIWAMRRSRYVTRRTSCRVHRPFACRADHLPGTRRHPQCPRLHAGRPRQGCHLGSRPYHGPNQAMGLSFSVPATKPNCRRARNIYKELNADLGCPIPATET